MKAFHSFSDLGIAGEKSADVLQAEADAVFRFGVDGHSVLDIGAWDGFFTFEAEARGAAQATASDWFCWGGPGWGTREVFDHVRAARGSSARAIEADIPDLNRANHGLYDTVLLLGVLYHVRDMVTTLDRAQDLCHNQLVIETATHPGSEPVAYYHPRDSLDGDGTNFWTPTVACIQAMMSEWGWQHFEVVETPHAVLSRHIVHCFRTGLPENVPPVGVWRG